MSERIDRRARLAPVLAARNRNLLDGQCQPLFGETDPHPPRIGRRIGGIEERHPGSPSILFSNIAYGILRRLRLANRQQASERS